MKNLSAINGDLEVFNLQDCNIGDPHIHSLAKGFLERNPGSKIKKLLLSGNQLLDESVKMFGRAYTSFKCNVTHLDLSNNLGITDAGVTQFCKTILAQ
jgi:hypothetical protein